jgi:hypothetical protein
MSNTQYAFLMRSKVPDREALQISIDALGFDLKLDPDFTPFTDSGFSPCVLNGVSNVGFEISYENAADFEEIKEIVGVNDFCISMTWHGSMKDCACALVVGSALAKDFGAVISYEGNPPDSLESLESLLSEAEQAIQNGMSEPADPPEKTAQVPRKPWWKAW